MTATPARRRYRPPHLRNVRVRRGGDGHWGVILLRDAWSTVPRHIQERWPDVTQDLVLGELETRQGSGSSLGRSVYGYEGSGAYRSPREAGESLAVGRIDGPAARQRFDVERSSRRRTFL